MKIILSILLIAVIIVSGCEILERNNIEEESTDNLGNEISDVDELDMIWDDLDLDDLDI
ncbi:hypothetical protein HOD61_01325 [archaeon]|jgi:hypothetical protein|nr:hypothetical protein [archaeon]